MNKVHAINWLGNMWYLLIAKHNFSLSSSKNNKQNYMHTTRNFSVLTFPVFRLSQIGSTPGTTRNTLSHVHGKHTDLIQRLSRIRNTKGRLLIFRHIIHQIAFPISYPRTVGLSLPVIRYHCNHRAHGWVYWLHTPKKYASVVMHDRLDQ